MVLARNWRCDAGEIDLVCRRRNVLVVSEVKTRTGDRFGTPFEAVGPAKQQRLRRLAARYLAEGRTTGTITGSPIVRFDVVGVRAGATDEVEVLEGAF